MQTGSILLAAAAADTVVRATPVSLVAVGLALLVRIAIDAYLFRTAAAR